MAGLQRRRTSGESDLQRIIRSEWVPVLAIEDISRDESRVCKCMIALSQQSKFYAERPDASEKVCVISQFEA